MKKAYITGTTQGLGKAIKSRLENFYAKNEYMFEIVDIVGLNRPEYNMETVEPYVKNDFEVYVINAHESFNQVELLYRLFEENQNRDCDIVVIGSVSADGDRKDINRYAVQKAAIDKAASQLQLVESRCRVMVIKPGRMKTQMTEHRTMFYRMHPHNVANTLIWMIEHPRCLNVKTLTLDVHHTAKELH